MSKTLILFALFSASLALVLVGCEEKQEVESDIIPYGELTEAIVWYPLPCPPCTVFAMPPGEWAEIRQTAWTDSVGTLYEFWWPDSLPGPDSAFILSEREE